MNELAERRATSVLPGFASESAFELLQRQARALSASSLVPKAYRASDDDGVENPQAFPNAMIALNMASRMRADPLMVMQNLHVINGVPGWSTKFLVATFNTCGRFTALRYAYSDDRTSCYAFAKEIATGETVRGPAASMVMAKAEGWTERRGSKWRTMPEVMLGNRAAAFMIRAVAPELSLGLYTREELDDVYDVGPLRELDERMASTPIAQVREVLQRASAPAAPAEPEPTKTDAALADLIDPEPAARAPAAAWPFGKGERAEPAPEVVSAAPSSSEPEPASNVGTPDQDAPRMLIEPKNLPVKDAPPRDDDTRTKRVKKPAFNVDAYARRIAATTEVDMLILFREEIAALAPSYERDDLLTLVDSRMHELVSEGDDNDRS